MKVVHPEGFQTGEHAMSSGTRFAERRVAQLPVEPGWKIRAKVETTVPDGADLAQIELTIFISKRKTLVTP